jgi:hypothetical protein
MERFELQVERKTLRNESAANSSILILPFESPDPFMVEDEFRDRARDIFIAHQR